jgi:hypothetical protein
MTTTAIGHERDSEKIAWGVLWSAFVVFLVLLFGIPTTIYWYLSTATDPHETNMTVLSGTVIVDVTGLQSSGERGTRMVPEGATIRTDDTSRVSLTLFDGSTVIVFPNTQVTLSALRTPRYSIGSQLPQVQVELHAGRLRVSVPASPDQHDMRMQTPQGDALLRRGDYLLEITGEQTDIVVRNGQALVSAHDATLTLNGRERSLLTTGDAPRGPLPAERDLLANGAFAEPLTDTWSIYNDQGGDGGSTNGVIEVVSEQGRRAVRFQRMGSTGDHDEAGIDQQINKDVVDAINIRLRADVLVNFQSLSGGGYLSSEYPIILSVHYRDVKGGDNQWVRGFYYQNDSHNPTANGELIPKGVWFPYESPNLAQVLNPKPAQILSVKIYASGWDFESVVSDAGLIIE